MSAAIQREIGRNGVADVCFKRLQQRVPPPLGLFWRYVGGPRQRSMPDLHGVIGGLFIAIEVKRPGYDPSVIQAHTLTLLEQAGGFVGVARCVEDVDQIVDRALRAALQVRPAAEHEFIASLLPHPPSGAKTKVQ